MAQIRLKNRTKSNAKVGSYVRIDPANPDSFLYVETKDMDVVGTVAQNVPPGNMCLIDLLGTGSSAALGEEFETVSKNLKSYPYTLSYGVDGLSAITYDIGGGLSIVKTFNYTLSVLTSIVLSGDTPSGIELTKTLSYTGIDLTGVAYS